jgi:serine/threonine-protein kinase
MRFTFIVPAVLGLGLVTRAASGASPQATALFNEGKTLVAQGHEAEGCKKLAESQRLEASIGARYQVAMCDERAGRTASAYAGYAEVAEMAKRRGQSAREKAAREKAASLEPRLVRIVLDVAGSSVPDLVIKRNDVAIARTDWNTPVLIDPGAYTFEASAPDHAAWRTTLEVADGQRSVSVHVPELDALATTPATLAPEPSPAAPVPAPAPARTSPVRFAAYASAATGLVVIGGAAFFTVQALGLKSDADPHCRGTMCDAKGASLRDDAVSHGNVATALFVAGGSLIAAAAALYVLTPSRRVEIAIGPTSVGVHGSF